MTHNNDTPERPTPADFAASIGSTPAPHDFRVKRRPSPKNDYEVSKTVTTSGAGQETITITIPADHAQVIATGVELLDKAGQAGQQAARYIRQWGEWLGGLAADCARLSAEVEALKGVVDKLPKCWRLNDAGELVQDVPMYPGMHAFDVHGTESICTHVRNPSPWKSNGRRSPDIGMRANQTDSFGNCDWSHLYYATREAALAAASAGPARDGGEDNNGNG